MINNNPSPPPEAPPPGDCPCANDGDPVNLATGLFTQEATDLALPDVIPIAVTRTYRQRDLDNRPFGIGMSHAYNLYLWSVTNYQQADLVLPDGSRIHYVRTSLGNDFRDAVYLHTTTPTAFYQSTLAWNPATNMWDVSLLDGTVDVFGENGPLQAIHDRHGNTVRLAHANGQDGNPHPGDVAERPLDHVQLRRRESHHPSPGQHRPHRELHLRRRGQPGDRDTGEHARESGHQSTPTTRTTASPDLTPPHRQGTGKSLVTDEFTTSAERPDARRMDKEADARGRWRRPSLPTRYERRGPRPQTLAPDPLPRQAAPGDVQPERLRAHRRAGGRGHRAAG